MSRRALLLFSLVLIALPCGARVRAVRHREPAPRVLWIGAHPDDEAVAAPLLAQWCVAEGARCAFLILTRGEAGACLLPDGCLPDVATVRSAEAGAAAELFHADLILLRYPNDGVWNHDEVVARVAGEIEAFAPDRILTFDPRHGTTCHPEHRQTGGIVLEAAARLARRPRIDLLETRVEFAETTIVFSPASPVAERFDATASWEWVVRDMERHPSQFSQEWLDAVRAVPAADRAVFFAEAEVALAAASACP